MGHTIVGEGDTTVDRVRRIQHIELGRALADDLAGLRALSMLSSRRTCVQHWRWPVMAFRQERLGSEVLHGVGGAPHA